VTICPALVLALVLLPPALSQQEVAHTQSVYGTCPAGMISVSTANRTECVQCEAGTYADADRTACKACPSDSTSATRSNASTDCACNAGFEGPAGGDCLLCPIGKFKATSGVGSCTSCPIGKYGGYWGNGAGVVETSCAPCPANSNTTTDGSTIDECQCLPWYTQVFSNTGDRTRATAPNALAWVSMSGPGWMPAMNDGMRANSAWFAMPSVVFPSAVQEARLLSVGGVSNHFWSSSAPPHTLPLTLCLTVSLLSHFLIQPTRQGRYSKPRGHPRVSSVYKPRESESHQWQASSKLHCCRRL